MSSNDMFRKENDRYILTLLFSFGSQETTRPLDYDNSRRRIFLTHIPYQLLAKTLDNSECRVVYITRNPKDTVVSMWNFLQKWDDPNTKGVPHLQELANDFTNGFVPYGPYYDHVLGYKSFSVNKPMNVFFITYEELKDDPGTHVKRLAEFLGCPFGQGEEEQVEEIVRGCSFEVLSSHQVNKSEENPEWLPTSYSSFFRKGTVGDHKTCSSHQSIQRINALTKDKFLSQVSCMEFSTIICIELYNCQCWVY